jgi:phospholipid/cholesterol/gamma-HCH transport system substrate-binding protein
MSHPWSPAFKFGAFAIVMAILTASLFIVFGNYRSSSTSKYSAVFADVSHLLPGDSVRFAGVRVGTVSRVDLQTDSTVVVEFDSDRTVALTVGTKAVVRYLNLVGDRYLELVDDPGSTRLLPAGARIPIENTASALNLDLLLGGLKPVVQGLNPSDVNALTASLIQVVQGQGGTIESLLSRTSSFTSTLADRSQTIQQLIDHLRRTVGTLSDNGQEFSDAIDRLQRLVTALAEDREPVGAAVDALNQGTASMSDLLGQARPPLAATVDQLGRLAPLLDDQKEFIDTGLVKAPENYRKLIRIGSYGSFVNYYLCSLAVRVSDLQNRTAVFPIFEQQQGRCQEP